MSDCVAQPNKEVGEGEEDGQSSQGEVLTSVSGSKNIPIKQLTHMMLNGQNDLVLAHLRSLPKDECNKTRTRWVHYCFGFR